MIFLRSVKYFRDGRRRRRNMNQEKNFRHCVFGIVREIPKGYVATYGQIAFLAGKPRAARAVGWALRCCPFPEVPCHRVINAQGILSPSEVFGGDGIQRERLEKEGVLFLKNGRVDLNQCLWAPWKEEEFPEKG